MGLVMRERIAKEFPTLRCDHCRHYKTTPVMDSLLRECLHPDNRWLDRDQWGEEFLQPTPDWFCAFWEAKKEE